MTTAATLTLAGFLEQRIAEDEAVAKTAIEERAAVAFIDPPEVPDLGMWANPDLAVPAVVVGPERVLAECEAKRRAVKYARSWRGEFTGTADTPDAPSQAGYGDAVLRAMAQVYKDHPDFNAHDWLI